MYHLIFFPIYLISLLPHTIADVTIGRFLYFISYKVFRYRYSVVLQNLSRSLPAKSYGEIQQIAKDYYKHLACMVIEIIKLFSVSSHSLDKKNTAGQYRTLTSLPSAKPQYNCRFRALWKLGISEYFTSQASI
ncbi:LpxL/LpxP family acyltransferase [Pedobacter sp. NJ-S-72]